MNSMSRGSRVWWETDRSLQVQLEAEIIYIHMDIRITHTLNIVYFYEAKYEKCWYFQRLFKTEVRSSKLWR